MPKSKVNSKKKLKTRKPLNPLRQKLQVLVTEANQRVENLISSGYDTRALSEARRTMIRFHREQDQLFTAALPRSRDIAREIGRVQAFLADSTSTVSGAQKEIAGLTHGLFGGQFRVNGGYGANPDFIDEDTANKVYEVYHKAMSQLGGYERVMGWLKFSGLTEYGSETLINAVYDMILNADDTAIFAAREDKSDNSPLTDEDRIDYLTFKAAKMMEEKIHEAQQYADLQLLGQDYGIIRGNSEARIRNYLTRTKLDEIEKEYQKNRKE